MPGPEGEQPKIHYLHTSFKREEEDIVPVPVEKKEKSKKPRVKGFAPTKEQEQLLFRNKDKKPIDIIKDPEFGATITEETAEKWILLFASNETVEGIIVAANQGLVHSFANRSRGRLDYGEKIAAGNEGLLKAIGGFDPDREVKFSHYASFKIRAEYQRATAEKMGITKYEYHKFNEALHVRGVCISEYGREPTREELEKQLLANTMISLKVIDLCLDIIYNRIAEPVSIFETNSAMDERAMETRLSDRTANVEDAVLEAETKRIVGKALEDLPILERAALYQAFGIGDDSIIENRDLNTPQSELDKALQSALVKLGHNKTIQGLKDAESSAFQQRKDLSDSESDVDQKALNEKLALAKNNTERVVILSNAGLNTLQISEKLGIERSWTQKLVKRAIKHGLIEPKKSRVEEAVILRNQGLTNKEIASQLGIGVDAVKLSLARGGEQGYEIAPHPPRRGSSLDFDKVKRYVEIDRLSGRAIAQLLGCASATVNRFINKNVEAGSISIPPGETLTDTASRIRQVVILRNDEGLSNAQIAHRLKIGRDRVRSLFVEAKKQGHELAPHSTANEIKNLDLAKIKRYIEVCELTYSEIEILIGVSKSTLSSYVKEQIRAGKIKKQQTKKRDTPENRIIEIVTLRNKEGLTNTQIGQRLGIGRVRVDELIAEAESKGYVLVAVQSRSRKALNRVLIKRYIEVNKLINSEIALLTGRSKSFIDKFVKKQREVGYIKKRLTRADIADAARDESTERIRLAMEANPQRSLVFDRHFKGKQEQSKKAGETVIFDASKNTPGS